jgi:fumarate hydratase subunit alpha
MGVREIPVAKITELVRRLCIEANTVLGDDVVAALKTSLAIEESPVGQDVFRQLIRNAEIARTEGILVSGHRHGRGFLEIGQDVHLTRGDLETAVNEEYAGNIRTDTCAPPPWIH